jgi:hypothetical protein
MNFGGFICFQLCLSGLTFCKLGFCGSILIAGQKQQKFSEIKAGLDDADGLVI